MGKSIHVLVGCDPELFCAEKGKKRLVTAYGLVPGNKYDPYSILDGQGTVQVDGCALEIGIKPAKTAYEWFDRIKATINELAVMVPDHDLRIQPVAEFDDVYFKKFVPKEAKVLGCEPDYNAWTGKVNPLPDLSKTPSMRSAGGHIHIGWCKDKDPFNKDHIEDCRLVAKQMDYYVGMWTLLWDKDDRRRSLYGKAGTYRPKPYGIEYRMPSNMWLSKDGLIDWVYYSTRLAVKHLSEGYDRTKEFGEQAREIIDNNQVYWKDEGSYKHMKLWNWHPQYRPESYLQNGYDNTRGPIWVD